MLETHGRSYEGIHELSESIGWFTQFYPVPLDWSQTGTNLMREIERAYEIATKIQLRYMGDPNWKKPPYPLLINFLGNFDENWGGIAQPSTLSQGSMVDENNFMMSIVEINALIIEGKIKWMLRSHPEFDLNGFAHEFEKFSNLGMLAVGDNAYIDASIDEDDREAIDDLLSEL